MQNPIASRILRCTADGKSEQVIVNIGMPYEDDRCFRCEYEIVLPDRTRRHAICGVDGIQALQLAMFVIGSSLSSVSGTSNWMWNGEQGTGFPMTPDG